MQNQTGRMEWTPNPSLRRRWPHQSSAVTSPSAPRPTGRSDPRRRQALQASHHGVSRSAKARQWVGAKLEHPRASWGLSSITWRYKRRRRPQGHSEDGHGPEMDRREDLLPNVNYLPAFATQRQREGAHQPGQAGQSHSSPSLLISPATTSGANTGDADVGTRCNLCECSHPDRQCTSSQETPPQMHADACYPHRRGSRSPSEVHEHTEDGPMPGQRRGRWMPPRQRGHQVHEANQA